MAKKRKKKKEKNSGPPLLPDLLSNIGQRSLHEEPTELNVATERQDRALSRILFNSTSASEAQDTEAESQEMPVVAGTQGSESHAATRRKRKQKGTSSAASHSIKNKVPPKTTEIVATDEGETHSRCFQQTNKQTNTEILRY